MIPHLTITLENEENFLQFAAEFSQNFLKALQTQCCVVFLEGELGVGKTNFVRGFLRGLGYLDLVTSPTYGFVQSYELQGQVRVIHHFDLYRISHPELFESMGFSDYFTDNTLCFIEWPTQGGAFLPKPNIHIHIENKLNKRCLRISADSKYGQSLLSFKQ